MKRKDYNEVVNKIVNIEQVLARGQREPALELTFKTSGYNRLGGHKVYIDYKCAKELAAKLSSNIDSVKSKYFAKEFYDDLHNSKEYLY
jgi:hypothetical protein